MNLHLIFNSSVIVITTGQMAVWVGGDKEAYTKVRPVLDASYSSVMYTGGLGTAMIPKVSTYICIQSNH